MKTAFGFTYSVGVIVYELSKLISSSDTAQNVC